MPGVRPHSSRWLVAGLLLAALELHGGPDGAALYEKYCIPCHGPDGRARSPAARKLKVKDLTASRLPDADIARQIANGTKDSGGKERMPSFKSDLAEAQLAALVGYVKSLRK
jgi:mono/diheme cytochrome c family protein